MVCKKGNSSFTLLTWKILVTTDGAKDTEEASHLFGDRLKKKKPKP